MQSLNDYKIYKQRSEEIRREVALNRLTRTVRNPGTLMVFWWELRRDAARLGEVFKKTFPRKRV